MAEPSRSIQARLWDRPTIPWRLVALVLVVIPQFAVSPMPDLGRQDNGLEEYEGVQAFVRRGREADEASSVFVRETGGAEAWFDFLSHSGLILLALAVAFILPGPSGRRAAFAVTWALCLCGVIAGYAASSAAGSLLWAYCVFYLSASAVLTITGIRSALARN
ncbi:hypothetical protein [Actinomadura alba]|uniref:Uncharacterized protein n=1 Tax=Actinomadura alba TaxID=406431 RepID=A0ABR7LZ19_9ACTN|nr:hypothetical protein [Actinomadura alba]MBC6470006.1 hypothetical protein [Actinomadura alba]